MLLNPQSQNHNPNPNFPPPMAYRTLDLTLISAKDLKDVNLFTPMRVYAVAAVSDSPRARQRIPPDRDGGRNPNWNATIHFTIPTANPANLLLRVLLRAHRLLGDRDVGIVQIPLRDVVATAGGTRFLSYQVRRPVSGKPKGVLNFSCKISDPITPHCYPQIQEVVIAYPLASAGCYAAPQTYGYGAPAMPMGYGYAPAGYGYPTAGYGYGAPASGRGTVNFGKKGSSAMGVAAGIMGGVVGGLLIGDMISDGGAYEAGGFEGGSGL